MDGVQAVPPEHVWGQAETDDFEVGFESPTGGIYNWRRANLNEPQARAASAPKVELWFDEARFALACRPAPANNLHGFKVSNGNRVSLGAVSKRYGFENTSDGRQVPCVEKDGMYVVNLKS